MKRGTPDHPKVAYLASLLNVPTYSAVGILELLWHFTARYAPQGDIGKHPDSVIAKAVYWQRPTGERGVRPECKLSGALVTAKWLDTCQVHRLIVHDWCDHADEAVRKFLSRHGLDFVRTHSSLPLPLPLPLPGAACPPVNGIPTPERITLEKSLDRGLKRIEELRRSSPYQKTDPRFTELQDLKAHTAELRTKLDLKI